MRRILEGGLSPDLHGDDGARDELAVVADGEVPGADPHQVVEVELDNEATLGVHLAQ